MNKNVIQEERIKGYFVQAAMEILRGEGIRDLSVRNVAEKAGYSYATLYNYFKNLDELLTVCLAEFLNENKNGIKSAIQYIPKGKQRVSMIYFSYIKYFVQYPGIYDLVYLAKLKNQNSRDLVIEFLDNLCIDDWNHLINERLFNEEEVHIKQDTLKFIVSGMLLLYNNLRYPIDYDKFQLSVKQQISSVLEL